MAWRAIQSNVGTSLSLAELNDLEERIWWRLLAHSDPWGRLDARLGKLRALCWPLLTITDEAAGRSLVTLQRVERIIVWEHQGQQIIQIIDFEKWQPREAFRKRPPASEFHDPPANLTPPEGLIERLYKLNPDTFRNGSGNSDASAAFAGLSGSTPETFRKPSGGDETEKRRDEREQEPHHQHVAREPDDDLRLRLETFKLQGPASTKAADLLTSDPARLEACMTVAAKRGTDAAGYLATLVLNGSHPEAPASAEAEQSTLAPGAFGATRSTRPPKLEHECKHPQCGSTFKTAERLAEHVADCHTELERAPIHPDVAKLFKKATPATEPPAPPRHFEPAGPPPEPPS